MSAELLHQEVQQLIKRVDCLPSSDEVQAILRGILVIMGLMLEERARK